MKKSILESLLGALAVGAYAQGQIALDNFSNTSTAPSAAANGLFWLSTAGSPVLINQDFNAAFYGGANSSSLALLSLFLLSDGSAVHDNAFPGKFSDPTVNVYTIQGATTSAFFQIQAWTGNFNSYAAAVAGGSAAAQSPVFVNPVELPPGPPADFINMPAMVLSTVPEPSIFALAGLGCSVLLWRWRRGNSDR